MEIIQEMTITVHYRNIIPDIIAKSLEEIFHQPLELYFAKTLSLFFLFFFH